MYCRFGIGNGSNVYTFSEICSWYKSVVFHLEICSRRQRDTGGRKNLCIYDDSVDDFHLVYDEQNHKSIFLPQTADYLCKCLSCACCG